MITYNTEINFISRFRKALFDVHNTRFNCVSFSCSYTRWSSDLSHTGCTSVWSFYCTGNQTLCTSDLSIMFLTATLNYVCSSLKLALAPLNSPFTHCMILNHFVRRGFDSFKSFVVWPWIYASRWLLTLSRREMRFNSFYLLNNLYIYYIWFLVMVYYGLD